MEQNRPALAGAIAQIGERLLSRATTADSFEPKPEAQIGSHVNTSPERSNP